MGRYFKRAPDEPAKRARTTGCAVDGCRRPGTCSHSLGQGEDGGHVWYCQDHYHASDLPLDAVGGPPGAPAYERDRQDLEDELRRQCEAAIGFDPPPYLWRQWWIERFRTYARGLAGRPVAGLAVGAAAGSAPGHVDGCNGEGLWSAGGGAGGMAAGYSGEQGDDVPF